MEIHRITPAYTGNTEIKATNVPLPEDHPRIHGEHDLNEKRKGAATGSPPHTRGTLKGNALIVYAIRITPAYTGNT